MRGRPDLSRRVGLRSVDRTELSQRIPAREYAFENSGFSCRLPSCVRRCHACLPASSSIATSKANRLATAALAAAAITATALTITTTSVTTTSVTAAAIAATAITAAALTAAALAAAALATSSFAYV